MAKFPAFSTSRSLVDVSALAGRTRLRAKINLRPVSGKASHARRE